MSRVITLFTMLILTLDSGSLNTNKCHSITADWIMIKGIRHYYLWLRMILSPFCIFTSHGLKNPYPISNRIFSL